MLRKSPNTIASSGIPPVRRNKSTISNGSNLRRDFKDEKDIEPIRDIENILEMKMQELNENIKNHKEDEHLNNITKMLESHLFKTNELICNTLQKQESLYEEREVENREKYEDLFKRYNNLHIQYEDQYFKFTKLISHYQYMIFKLCSIDYDKNDTLKDTSDEIKKVLEFNVLKENEKREALITNPITLRRYTNPVIKRSHVNIENKEPKEYNKYNSELDNSD